MLAASLCAARPDETSNEQKILDNIIAKNDQLALGPEKDAVLVVGPVGSGKTALTLLLTGAELEAKEIAGTDGDLRIIDKYNQISESTTAKTAKTIVPNLIFDDINGTAYYDCPGFSDTKEVNADIASTFTLRKLLNFIESLKFIFTVNYESIKPAVRVQPGSFNFGTFGKFESNLFNHLEKYRDAIALVVTKVPNNLDDAAVIESIAVALQNHKIMLENALNTDDSTHTADNHYSKQIRFIEILLEKDGDKYPKIGIFRMPNKNGPLNDIQSVQNDKAAILHIVNEKLLYVRKEPSDFNFSLALNSRIQIDVVVERILTEIIKDFKIISGNVKAFILREEKHHSRNLGDSIALAERINEKLLQIDSNEPQEFKRQFVNIIDDLAISISGGSLWQSLQLIEILDFLSLFSDRPFTIPSEILDEFANLKAYIKNSLNWYAFLINLHDKLATYDIQKRSHEIDGDQLMNSGIYDESIEQAANELNIKSSLDLIDPKLYTKIENLLVNSYKLNLLHAVWGQSMQPVTGECLADGAHLVVKGYNARLSSIIEMDCFKAARHVQIFALHKVFIDTDINHLISNVTLDMAIISPQWEIIADHVLNFSGHGGNSMDAARDSYKYPENGAARENLKYPERGEDGATGHSGLIEISIVFFFSTIC